MATRKRKIRKLRGSRTCGKGSHKKARSGKGSRGGRGMAGSFGQKFSYVIKYMPDHIGKRGFTPPKVVRKEYKCINVGILNEKAEEYLREGLAELKDDKIYIDVKKLGYDKVLGAGIVTKKLIVKAKMFSKRAVEKIKAAGGEIITD